MRSYKCTPVCGTAFQTREAFCDASSIDLCDFDRYPITKRPCAFKPCYEWISDEWSEVFTFRAFYLIYTKHLIT